MTYAALIALLALIAIRHYRRKYIRETERCAKLRTTVEALMQERWEAEVTMAKLHRELEMNEEVIQWAATAVESLNRNGPVLTTDQDWRQQ